MAAESLPRDMGEPGCSVCSSAVSIASGSPRRYATNASRGLVDITNLHRPRLAASMVTP